jgi:UDP-glucose 4-epimerase
VSEKKILVTGGAGSMGSNLSELVLNAYEILVVDNFSSGHQEAVDRVAKCYDKKIHYVELDLCEGPKLNEVVKRFKPNAVIHLAGLKSVNESISMPVSYYLNNVYGTLNLPIAMDLAGCEKIVFSSSATVYGSPNSLPIEENHTFNPINPHGKSKLMVEEILKDWVVVYDARSAISLRYFNPVGAHRDSIIGEDPRVIGQI